MLKLANLKVLELPSRIECKEVSPLELRKVFVDLDLHPVVAKATVELLQEMQKGKYLEVTYTVRDLLGREPTTLQQWAKSNMHQFNCTNSVQ